MSVCAVQMLLDMTYISCRGTLYSVSTIFVFCINSLISLFPCPLLW